MPETTALPTSTALRPLLERVRDTFPRAGRLHTVFETCLLSTLETTLKPQPDGTVFVITGDIPAMWLRDSSAQVRPYLMAAQDPQIGDLLEGVSRRQVQCVLLDPYANAFNDGPSGRGHQQDHTLLTPWLWERKYEVDSLAAVLELAYLLWKGTGRTAHLNADFARAAHSIVALWRLEQDHTRSSYRFERPGGPPLDTLSHGGQGAPVGLCGMTWSGFRPSDDACTYGYLIPANMLAAVALEHLGHLATQVLRDDALAQSALALRAEIVAGIAGFGTVEHPELGHLYAYETDGLGHHLLMDDANVPSLLSAPYLGFCSSTDPIYQATRRWILSPQNPYFYAGSQAQGVGSPHTPAGMVWPISLCMQGLTATTSDEQDALLETLLRIDAGTGAMHEGVDVNDPRRYTREWFAWANSLFAEFVLARCGLHVPGSPLER